MSVGGYLIWKAWGSVRCLFAGHDWAAPEPVWGRMIRVCKRCHATRMA